MVSYEVMVNGKVKHAVNTAHAAMMGFNSYVATGAAVKVIRRDYETGTEEVIAETLATGIDCKVR